MDDQTVTAHCCPHGCGMMWQEEGLWALTGVTSRPDPEGGLAIAEPVGRALVFRVWRCHACGQIELSADMEVI